MMHLNLIPLAQLGTTAPATGNPDPASGSNPSTAGGAGVTNTTIQSGLTGADGAQTKPADTQKAAAPSGSIFSNLFVPLTLMLVLLYFVLFRGQRKDEKKRKAMISEMKKGDRVMTIGGMVARVTAIDGDEITLKIDESANVKAVYMKSAIQKVLSDEKAK